jgi:hypothetical protein
VLFKTYKQNKHIPAVNTTWLAQVACKNNYVQVFYMHTRLTVNGVLKGILKKGDS